MKPSTITILLLAACFFCNAQNIQVSDLTIDGAGMVSFNYSIAQKLSSRETYQLQIFTSADQFNRPIPLTLSPVSVGETKKVSFSGPALVGNHSGALQFKFRAEATLFPVVITTTENKFKSGKNITISWDDFHESGWYDIELYEGGYIKKTLAKNFRGTILSTSLPKKMTKGVYEVRVTPTNEKNLYSEDYPVTISSGGGAGIYLLAGGALAGVGVFALGGGGDGDTGGGGSTGGTSLPDPPEPDGN